MNVRMIVQATKPDMNGAEARDLTNPLTCEDILSRSPNRTSFYEGCVTYTEDPSRGADEDDDGKEID